MISEHFSDSFVEFYELNPLRPRSTLVPKHTERVVSFQNLIELLDHFLFLPFRPAVVAHMLDEGLFIKSVLADG